VDLVAVAWLRISSALPSGTISWLRGHDPFPGPLTFSLRILSGAGGGALFLIRAARRTAYPGSKLSLDATISSLVSAAFFGSW